MMRYIMTALCLLVVVVGCSRDYSRDEFLTINCSKRTTATIKASEGEETVIAIHLHIEGRVAGKGLLELCEGEKTTKVSGKVNLNWGGDWYQPDCKITFTPTETTSGELRVYYKFDTIARMRYTMRLPPQCGSQISPNGETEKRRYTIAYEAFWWQCVKDKSGRFGVRP